MEAAIFEKRDTIMVMCAKDFKKYLKTETKILRTIRRNITFMVLGKTNKEMKKQCRRNRGWWGQVNPIPPPPNFTRNDF